MVLIPLNVGLDPTCVVTFAELKCFGSMQMPLKTIAIDGGIIQKKIDLGFRHLCALDAHS